VTYTRMGKQILTEDGEHFADGASEAAAILLVEALNLADQRLALQHTNLASLGL
jgi:hypothetical protein